MSKQSLIKSAAAGLLGLSLAACATASGPWQAHDRTADLKTLAADLDRACPVVVNNGTDQVLEALLDLEGVDRSLGLLAAGQSVTVEVACSARRVNASAVSQDLWSEGRRFRKSVVLDVVRETRLRFTHADRVGG